MKHAFTRKYRSLGVLRILSVLLIAVQFFASIPTAFAAFPEEINYQGKLVNAAGSAVADGSYSIQFKLYTAATGGTALWTETWCYSPDNGVTCDGTGTDNRIPLENGLFSTMLGSTTALSGVDFNQTLYLGVNVGGASASSTWDGEMTPRKRLGTVPAAIEAKRVGGLNANQFLRSDATNATSSASTFVTINQTGAGKALEILNGSAALFSVLSDGSVGIGTSSPYAKLSVVGQVVASHFTGTTSATSTFGGPLVVTSTATSTFANGVNISGGCFAVNGTCVGGGAGAVSSVSNADGTLTISPTTGDIVASLNLANANAWTGLQRFTNASSTLFSVFNTLYVGGSATTTIQGDATGTSTFQGFLSVTGTNSTSTFSGGIQATAVRLTGSATSTATNGINLSAGCFAINGVCAGTGTVNSGTAGQVPYYAAAGTAITATSTLFISTASFVGIGTTSPYAKLSVVGQIVGEYFTATSTTATSSILGSLSIGSTTPSGAALFSVGTASPNFFVNKSSGNVGVGTTSPYVKFSVAGESGANYFTSFATTATSTLAGSLSVAAGAVEHNFASNQTSIDNLLIGNLNFDSDPGIVSWVDASVTTASASSTTQSYTAHLDGNAMITLYGLSDGTGSVNTLRVGIGSTTPTERFSVEGTALATAFRAIGTSSTSTFLGTVGIGTTSPYAKLSVVGQVVASHFTATSTATSTFGGPLVVTSTATSTATNGINLSAGCFAINGTCVGGSSGSGIVGSGTTGQLPYYAAGGTTLSATSSIFISTAGFVGIGTTSPYAKLSVDGHVVAAYFTGTTTATSTFGGPLSVTTTATSSFANGINLSAGCFALNGTCLGGGSGSGTVGSGTTGQLPYYAAGGTALSATSTLFISTAGFVGIGTTSPYAKLSVVGGVAAEYFIATSSSATSTIAGGLNVGSGALVYDRNSAVTSIANLELGSFNFDDDAGQISWTDMAVTTASPTSTPLSYSAQIDGNPILTVRALSDGAGGIYSTSTAVGIGTTSPYAKLSVVGEVVASHFTGTTTATSTFGGPLVVSSTATSTFAQGINLSSGCFAINGTCVTGSGGPGSGTVNSGLLGQTAYYSGNGTAVSGTSTLSIATDSSLVLWGSTTRRLRVATTTADGENAIGVALDIHAGDASAVNTADGYGGAISIRGGNGTGDNGSSQGGSVTIAGGSGEGAGSATLRGGDGYSGGAVTVRGGENGYAGGAATFRAGDGGGGNGGALTIRGGDDSSADGGAVTIRGGNSVAANGAVLTIGAGSGGSGGGVTIVSGAGEGSSAVTISTANGGVGSSGNLTLYTGNAGVSSDSDAGDIVIYGGAGDGAGVAGDVLLAWTGSASRGNVGIGTSSPYAKLSVEGDVVASRFYATSTTGTSTFAAGLSAGTLNVAGLSGLSVTSAGRVGIGTSTPAQALSVVGSGIFSQWVTAGGINPGGYTGSSTSGYGITLPAVTNDATQIYGEFSGSDTSNGVFYTNDNANDGWYFRNFNNVTTLDYMRIARDEIYYVGTGNFGIGTSSPYAKLSVAGDIVFGAFHSTSTTGTSTIASNLHVQGTLRSSVSYVGDLVFANMFRFVEGDLATTVPQFLHLQNQYGDKMLTIGEDGNVGIGTTTPDYKLHVIGDVAATSFVNVSTRDAKKDITYYDPADRVAALESLRALKVAEYRYSFEEETAPLRLGLIAEEAPSSVLAPGGKGVDVYKLSTLAIAALQEMDVRYTKLEERVLVLERQGVVGFALEQLADAVLRVASLSADNVAATYATFKTIEVEKGLQLKDTATGNVYCVTIVDGEWSKSAGGCSAISPSGNTGEVGVTPESPAGPDTEAPTLLLIGANPLSVQMGTVFQDMGATALDDRDDSVAVELATSTVNTVVAGEYVVTYRATDSAGNTATISRTVNVGDFAGGSEAVVTPLPEDESSGEAIEEGSQGGAVDGQDNVESEPVIPEETDTESQSQSE